MKAPSERHLEDWMVANPGVWGMELFDEDTRVVGRQIPVPSGRVDLFALVLDEFCVVELKKGELCARDLSQVLRYVNDMQQVWRLSVMGLPDPDPGAEGPIGMTFGTMAPQIHGVLVGHSIDRWTYESARGAHVNVLLYDFSDDEYEFNFLSRIVDLNTCWDFACNAVGEAMRQAYMRRLSLHYTKEAIAAMCISDDYPWEPPKVRWER